MSAVQLPKKLNGYLDDLAIRVRRIAVSSALARALFLLPAVALVLILADSYLSLPVWARTGLLGLWCLLVVREAMNILWALTVRIDPEAIARAIETEYPRMGERLTTAVELSRHADESNGSPELIREVLRDAQNRTERLDVERVFPKAPATRGLWSAALAFLVILLPLAFVPASRSLAGRFFAPWHVPAVVVDYKIVVTTGDPAIKRGDAITLAGYLEPTRAGATLPASATLVIISNGREDRLEMTAEDSSIFKVTRPSAGEDFDYRIEAGLAVSETHHVWVVEPITLAKATITITPPAYAKPANDAGPAIVDGLGELTSLEHGRVTFGLRFSPTPKAVTLEFAPEGGDKNSRKRQNVSLNENGETSIVWPARQSGVFQLVAEGERGVRSEFPAQPLHVLPDEQPKFPRVAGLHEKSREIRPTEVMRLDVTATDDIAISRLALEYKVNDGPVQTRPLNTATLNTTQADGKLALKISEIAKTGDMLEMRLVASDNRRVPELNLEPQTTRHPAKDWAEFRVRDDAAPLAEQDINRRKTEIEGRLREIRDELKADSRATYSLRRSLGNKRTPSPDEMDRLAKTREELEKTAEKTRELADETAVTPELRKLSEAIRRLEEGDVRTAAQSLASARDTTNTAERNKKLTTADESLENALRQVEELLAENERLAKERLDKRKLQELADEQKELADKSKTADAKQAEELKKRQEEIQSRLRQLKDQSESIKKAIEAARAGESDKLAAEAEKLAKEIRDLNKAMEATDRGASAGRLEELRKKQEELTRKSREFGNQTDNASRAAQAAPLKTDDSAKTALDKGDLDEAAKQQEKAAQELDRLAADLENAAAKTRNPREAAGQLAQLQEALRQRLGKETKDKPLANLPKEERDALARQQEAIEKAAAKLKTPPGDTGADVARQRAASDAKKATDALRQGAADNADRRMRDAKTSLDELAARLPTDEQRLGKAREELNKLKADQEALRREAEQAIKEAADKPDELRKKLADTARKEAALAEKLQSTDTPGQEQRQRQTAGALEKAAADLTRAKPDEIARSQQAAKDELEKLEKALNNKTPPEAKAEAGKTPGENADDADRLARRQRELAEATGKTNEQLRGQNGPAAEKARKEARATLNQRQEELARQLGQLGGSDAPKERQQAGEAMADAGGELDRENFEGAVKRQKDAADALDRLSRESRKEEARRQSERNADLPNQEQADSAKRLAREQRDLRDEAMRVNDELRKQNTRRDNPAGELAKEQDRLAKQARDLAQKSAERQGEQSDAAKQAGAAAEAADQGAKKLQNGELADAKKAGEQARESLEQMAKAAPGGESAQKARELARRQEDINKKLGELAGDPGAARAQQQAREKNLAEQAQKLGEQLDKAAREGAPANNPGKQAGQEARQAGEQLRAATEADGKNQGARARESREQAANSLGKAAGQARAGAPKAGTPSPDASPQAGDAVQKAEQQMEQAGNQLGQGKPGEANGQMQDAARSLEQAANQLGQGQSPGQAGEGQPGQPGQPGQRPNGNPGGPGGTPDLRSFPADVAKHNGKAWGELPGEVRTKIIQQMSARYGEDYARNIKLYFEQLAERK